MAVDSDPPIDTPSLLERCLNDPAFVREILSLFREQTLQWLPNLRQRIKAGDPAGTEEIAHSLKGSAANLSAYRLSQICAELEHCAHTGRIDHAEPDAEDAV